MRDAKKLYDYSLEHCPQYAEVWLNVMYHDSIARMSRSDIPGTDNVRILAGDLLAGILHELNITANAFSDFAHRSVNPFVSDPQGFLDAHVHGFDKFNISDVIRAYKELLLAARRHPNYNESVKSTLESHWNGYINSRTNGNPRSVGLTGVLMMDVAIIERSDIEFLKPKN